MTHSGGAHRASATRWGVRRGTALLSVLLLAMLGLVGVSKASAAPPEECVPSDGTPASFTDWVPSGDPITTEENEPPGEDTDTERYIYGGETDPVVTIVPGTSQHYALKGNSGIGVDEVPLPPGPGVDYWQANTEQEPPGHYGHHNKPDGSLYVEGEEGLHYASHGSSGLRDWFYFDAGDEVSDTDSLWQLEVRDAVPAVEPTECDDTEVEGEEDEIPGKDSPNQPTVQVAGEQAEVAPAPPTSVNAGLGEIAPADSSRSPLGLLLVMFGALLTAAAVARRRVRA